MKLTEFIRRQLSENGEPSNNRVMLFLFLSTVVALVVAATIAPLFQRSISLPVIPPSFETLVEYVTFILVGGVAVGKGITAYKDKGSTGTTITTTATSTEVKGTTDASATPTVP